MSGCRWVHTLSEPFTPARPELIRAVGLAVMQDCNRNSWWFCRQFDVGRNKARTAGAMHSGHLELYATKLVGLWGCGVMGLPQEVCTYNLAPYCQLRRYAHHHHHHHHPVCQRKPPGQLQATTKKQNHVTTNTVSCFIQLPGRCTHTCLNHECAPHNGRPPMLERLMSSCSMHLNMNLPAGPHQQQW